MEKLCYVLWKPPGAAGGAFRDALLGEVAPVLLRGGARGLSVLVADEAAEAVSRARISRMADPIAGMVGVWLDCVDARPAVEAALRPFVSGLAGYLVTESVPLPNTTQPAPLGARTPGITMFTCIEKPERLSTEAWLDIWHGIHTPLAMEIQCTYRYVRNVVARPLTEDAPPWRGLVEEGFPADAVTNPALWYKAEGDPARLRENLGRMVASVKRFLDIERVESHPLSEYVLS